MKIFRLTKKKYSNDFSGRGAEIFGGRWNPIGTPAIYFSENRSLCILELLAHTKKDILHSKFSMITFEVPKNLTKKLKEIKQLPKNWDDLQVNDSTQTLGRKSFFNKQELGIIVPSIIVKQEKNIVVNPKHISFEKLIVRNVEDYSFDLRILE